MEPEQALVGMRGEGHWLALAQWLVTLPAHPPHWQFTISPTTAHPHWPPPRTPVSFLSLGIRLPPWMASWAHLLLHPHYAARDSERWRCTWAASHTCAPYPVPFLLPGAALWTGRVITQLRQEGERDTMIRQRRFSNAISPAQGIKPQDQESGVCCQNSNSAVPTTKPCSLLKPWQDCPSSTERHTSPIVWRCYTVVLPANRI